MSSTSHITGIGAQNTERLWRPWVIVFSAVAVLVVALSLTFFAVSAGRPYMGAFLARTEHGWIVQSVDPNGVAFEVGIRPGDRPLVINGEPADAFLSKYKKTGVVNAKLIKKLTVTSASGQVSEASVLNTPQPLASITEVIAYLVVSVSFWAAGFYVFYKRPKNMAALLLCLCSLVLGFAFSSQMAAERVFPAATYLEIVASTIGPWLLLHFFLVLPEERVRLRNTPLTYLIYVPAAIMLALLPLIGISDGQPDPVFRNFRLLIYGLGFLAVAATVIFNYIRATAPKTRQQMKIVLIGTLLALIPFLGVGILPALWYESLTPYGFNFVFIAIIPLSMGYAVVTQKFMDIDVIIRRGVIYGFVSLIMAAILSVAMIFVGIFKSTLGVPQQILIALALGVIAALLFGPTKDYVGRLVDRLLYKDRYDYRKITQTLSASLNKAREHKEMSRLVVAATVETLNLSGACLFVRGQTGQLEIGAAHGTYGSENARDELFGLLARRNRNSLYEFPNHAAENEIGLAFVIPLVSGDKEVGVLCLADKVTRQDFSPNDLFLLQGVASATAIALRSAALCRDVDIRDTFIAIASHEFNTPLTAIVGFSDMLLRREYIDPDREKRALLQINEHGIRIRDMVEDLLNVSRIQSGSLGLKLDVVKVGDILEEKVAFAREMSQKHEFVFEAGKCCDWLILVDREKFGQVVWNLLSNAIKYSPKGGTISVSVRSAPANEEMRVPSVVVSVSDEGMGIAPEDKETLFKTFHRIQRPETVGIKGSGLGLYIVKEWAEALGGRVWLESELNKGSTFFVAVPVPTPAQTEAAMKKAARG